jgi:YbbR domain-containing protein
MATKLKFITENLSIKLFALAVAILLFLFVSVESATPVDVDFPINYDYDKDVMMITNNPPTVVHTTLQGPWASLRSFDVDDLPPVSIDLRRDGPGMARKTIDFSFVQAPGGMKVISVRPSEVEITLDRKIERLVSVQVDVTGEPAPGYVLESVTSDPPRVAVQGPMTAIQGLQFVATRPLDIDGRSEDLVVEVDLKAPASSAGAPLRINEKRVRVSVQITEEFVTRSFDNLEVMGEGAPAGTKLVPDRVSLKLKGPKSLVDALDPKTLEAFVEVQPEYDAGETTFEKVVKLRGQPERSQWVGQAPKVVVQIPRAKVKKKK